MPTQLPEEPRPRIPLIATPSNREQVTTVDAKLINGYLEQGTNKEIFVYKRPGITNFYSNKPGNGMGLYNWLGDRYSIFGANFYKNETIIGTVNTAGGRYTFEIVKGLTPKLFFHNATNGYNYDDVNGLVPIVSKATYVVTGDTTDTSAVVTGILPDTTGITANSGITGVGIPAGSYVVSVDGIDQVTINTPATANGTAVSLTFETGGFPISLVPGNAYLDGTVYVMTPEAKIWGSEINDTTTWDGLNYISAQIEPDNGIAIAKQLVYVVAFKEWSTELFYDAGNAVGSPLTSVQGNKVNQGCRHAGSIQDIDGTLIWISRTRSGSVGVMAMENARATPIGSPSVERLLQVANFDECYSLDIKISGHRFYIVSLPVSNLTLVYDLTTLKWFQWTASDGTFWPYLNSIADSSQNTLIQHATNGQTYYVLSNFYSDNGDPFPWDLYTDNWDGGTRKPKYLSGMDLIGDQVDSILQIRVSDDDYQTWSAYRDFDLSRKRPRIRDCGTFLRRAWHLHHRADTALRLEAIELQVSLGTF